MAHRATTSNAAICFARACNITTTRILCIRPVGNFGPDATTLDEYFYHDQNKPTGNESVQIEGNGRRHRGSETSRTADAIDIGAATVQSTRGVMTFWAS